MKMMKKVNLLVNTMTEKDILQDIMEVVETVILVEHQNLIDMNILQDVVDPVEIMETITEILDVVEDIIVAAEAEAAN